MRHPNSPNTVSRIAAALLVAAMLSPAAGWAQDAEEAAEEATPPPAPVEKHWYDTALHDADVAVDLVIVRPLAALTLAAGAVLFVPAALMTAPNGKDGLRDAYDRFVREPGEYFYSRPLGEF